MTYRIVLIALVCCFLAPVLCGCCGAERSLELRNPLRFNSRTPTIAGPDYVQVPQIYAPTYTPAPSAFPMPAAPRAPGCP